MRCLAPRCQAPPCVRVPSLRVASRRAQAAPTDPRPRTCARRSRAVLHRVRQRRFVDLLRARADGRHRARPHPDRLHHQRRDLRGDRRDLRGGHRPLSGGGRLVELRPPRVQRARLVRGGVGADAQLRDHRRDLGDLRSALPLDLLGAAAHEPVGHHRRDRPHLAARRASTSSGSRRRRGSTSSSPSSTSPPSCCSSRSASS